MFEQIRQLQSGHARTRVFGLFAFVWFGLVLQPCAFAVVSESDCPHCPPEVEQVAEVIRSHCDPDPSSSPEHASNYDSAHTECCDLDEGIVNPRLDTSNADDDAPAMIVKVDDSTASVRSLKDSRFATGPPQPAGTSVPLHVLNCVYLD